MSIYHLSVVSHSRRNGGGSGASAKQATSAAHAVAYALGLELTDEWTGEIKSFKRRLDVLPGSGKTFCPKGLTFTNEQDIWGRVDAAETRINSKVCRTMNTALPHELSDELNIALAHDFAKWLSDRYMVPVAVGIHMPDGGDDRNIHAHFVIGTRQLMDDGVRGKKTRILDHTGTAPIEIRAIRAHWASTVNAVAIPLGVSAIDHRSYADQGRDQIPGTHLGSAALAFERRTGRKSGLRLEIDSKTAVFNKTRDEGLAKLVTHVQNLEAKIAELDAASDKCKLELASILQNEQATASKITPDVSRYKSVLGLPTIKPTKLTDHAARVIAGRPADPESRDIIAVGRNYKRMLLTLAQHDAKMPAPFNEALVRKKYLADFGRNIAELAGQRMVKFETELKNAKAAGAANADIVEITGKIDQAKRDRQAPSKSANYQAELGRFEADLKQRLPRLIAEHQKVLEAWAAPLESMGALEEQFLRMGGEAAFNAAIASHKNNIRPALMKMRSQNVGSSAKKAAFNSARLSCKHLRESGKSEEEIKAMLEMEAIHREVAAIMARPIDVEFLLEAVRRLSGSISSGVEPVAPEFPEAATLLSEDLPASANPKSPKPPGVQ